MLSGVFKSFFALMGKMGPVSVSVKVVTVQSNQTTSYGKQPNK